MSQANGAVTSIHGTAFLTRNGETRPLIDGEPVYPSDIIQAEAGSQVIITNNNGETLISGGQSLIIEAEVTEITELQAQINAGIDPTFVTEPTASGQEQENSEGEQGGHNTVYVTQNAEEGIVSTGTESIVNESTEKSVNFSENQNESPTDVDGESDVPLQIVINELPTVGTLYYTDESGKRAITESDLKTSESDTEYTSFDQDKISYDNVTSLGDKSTGDWGEINNDGSITPNSYTTITAMDSNGNIMGNAIDVVDSNYYGHGLSINGSSGIDSGENINIAFDVGMSSLAIGLDGIGGNLEFMDNAQATITVTYESGESETFDYQRTSFDSIFFTVTMGDGEAYDYDIGDNTITNISFSTNNEFTDGRDASWVLRSVDAYTEESTLQYQTVDANNQFGEETNLVIDTPRYR